MGWAGSGLGWGAGHLLRECGALEYVCVCAGVVVVVVVVVLCFLPAGPERDLGAVPGRQAGTQRDSWRSAG
jgi:hypothetical protein